MLAFSSCPLGQSRTLPRSFCAFMPLLFALVLSGCAASLPQSVEQSLSVFVPKKVDFAEIEYYANRSKSAYDPIEEIRETYPDLTRVTTVQPVEVLYFIETDLRNRTQTLTIRGTAEKPNVWEDLETALVADNILGIPMHRGFQRDADAVYLDATPHLRKDLPIRITGHSLGGAVAVILAWYFEKGGYSVERLVTFGQPKITSAAPPEKFFSVATRVVNELDVVPMVPPYTAVRPYQHFTPEVILKEGPNYVYLSEQDADRVSIGEFWRNLTDFSRKEHHIDVYLANIQEKVADGSRQVPYLFKGNSKRQEAASLSLGGVSLASAGPPSFATLR